MKNIKIPNTSGKTISPFRALLLLLITMQCGMNPLIIILLLTHPKHYNYEKNKVFIVIHVDKCR